MGVLDEAFMSRIHVSLFFKDLTDDDRKQIWKNNIKRLGETNVRITKDAQEYLISAEVMARKWNGREIRNGKQQQRLDR
jgi:ATP-dependent Clp protease ATP-binding subunit ClpA